jgi:hypothetical protein
MPRDADEIHRARAARSTWRSVADADQRARWISAEALAAAEKKNRPCRGPRADDDA